MKYHPFHKLTQLGQGVVLVHLLANIDYASDKDRIAYSAKTCARYTTIRAKQTRRLLRKQTTPQPAEPSPAVLLPPPAAPPGHYPDPLGRADTRFWSGREWTDKTTSSTVTVVSSQPGWPTTFRNRAGQLGSKLTFWVDDAPKSEEG